MKTKISLLALFGLSFAFGDAQQTILVTPQSLAGWTVTGADRQAMAAQPALVLPAGAQLARAFPGPTLALKVSTRPQFGLTPADWPVLEIGNAALVFMREGGTGKLALVLGTETPVELPGSYALDADGRSVEPLAVTFAREGAVVKVEAAGRKLSLPVAPAPEPGLEAVASAGAGNGWSLDRLEVATPTAEAVTAAAAVDTSAGAPAGSAGGTVDRKSGAANPKTEDGPSGTAAAPGPTGAPPAAAAATGKAGAGTLEIFTPASVRHGRADTVRNAVANGLQK